MDGGIIQYVGTEEGDGIAADGSILRPCSLTFKQTSDMPQSVNGVRSGGRPPPFLTKTLVMVEDPETNCIISWNHSGTSFIIWDHLKFAKELLPKYFKHSNFSSFIYQLNNYGFKKIGLRQYEYESKWFQAGKQHLLMNMKRRTDVPVSPKSARRQRGPRKVLRDAEKSRMLVDLENLRESLYLMKLETQKLKEKKVELENHISTFKEQGKDMESKAQKMFRFLSTILGSSLVQEVIENSGEEQELESRGNVRKKWLIAPKTIVSLDKLNNLSGNNQVQNTPPEKRTISSDSVDDSASGSQIPGQDVNNSNSEVAAKTCDTPVNWQKFLEEYSVSENEAEEQELAQQKHSKIDMAFDDMMASKIVMMEVEDVIAKEPITDMDDEVTVQLW